MMKAQYDGKIVMIYHPSVMIEPDGTMAVKYASTDPVFASVCSQYDILYIDMGPYFLKAYDEKQVVPYGFANTAPASGHLNRWGHELMALAIDEQMKEEDKP